MGRSTENWTAPMLVPQTALTNTHTYLISITNTLTRTSEGLEERLPLSNGKHRCSP